MRRFTRGGAGFQGLHWTLNDQGRARYPQHALAGSNAPARRFTTKATTRSSLPVCFAPPIVKGNHFVSHEGPSAGLRSTRGLKRAKLQFRRPD